MCQHPWQASGCSEAYALCGIRRRGPWRRVSTPLASLDNCLRDSRSAQRGCRRDWPIAWRDAAATVIHARDALAVRRAAIIEDLAGLAISHRTHGLGSCRRGALRTRNKEQSEHSGCDVASPTRAHTELTLCRAAVRHHAAIVARAASRGNPRNAGLGLALCRYQLPTAS